MPGKSHSGAAAPLTQREVMLRDSLRRDVEKLAGEIGERNLIRYEALTTAATFLEQGLTGAGYKVELNSLKLRRLMAALDAQPDRRTERRATARRKS